MKLYKSIAFLLITIFISSTIAVDISCNFRKAFFGGDNVLTCFASRVRESIGDNPDELNVENECDLPANTTLDDVEGIFSKDIEWPRFPINLYKKFPRLRALELDNCGIDTLRSTYFFKLTFLQHISLPRNKLTSLQGRLFRYTPNLRWIKFHGNLNLKNIGFKIFGNLRYLKEVDFGQIGCGGGDDLKTTDTSLFARLASRLVLECPPEEDDLTSDLEIMDCTFDPEKESESKPKNSKENTKEAL